MTTIEEENLNWYLSEIFLYPNEFGDEILETYANGVSLEEIVSSLRGEYSMEEKLSMLRNIRERVNSM